MHISPRNCKSDKKLLLYVFTLGISQYKSSQSALWEVTENDTSMTLSIGHLFVLSRGVYSCCRAIIIIKDLRSLQLFIFISASSPDLNSQNHIVTGFSSCFFFSGIK